MIDHLFLPGALDLDGGHEFVARAARDVARLAAQSKLSLTIDCSAIDPADAQSVAMLVVVAHGAARHGMRVRLASPTVQLRRDLDLYGVTHLFDYG